ncbi:hypothetical protein PUN28_008708 [Cardiocondyla obscurior]|uniref:Uncharacterized protein n=1 Tax=Cardiocondyla obscurior TaxID=286306 RepID=A0AAW2FYZ6_9HYME
MLVKKRERENNTAAAIARSACEGKSRQRVSRRNIIISYDDAREAENILDLNLHVLLSAFFFLNREIISNQNQNKQAILGKYFHFLPHYFNHCDNRSSHLSRAVVSPTLDRSIRFLNCQTESQRQSGCALVVSRNSVTIKLIFKSLRFLFFFFLMKISCTERTSYFNLKLNTRVIHILISARTIISPSAPFSLIPTIARYEFHRKRQIFKIRRKRTRDKRQETFSNYKLHFILILINQFLPAYLCFN